MTPSRCWPKPPAWGRPRPATSTPRSPPTNSRPSPPPSPPPGAHELIRAWSATGRPLAIVSNNSTTAIRAYLDLHHLSAHVAHVSAHTSADPTLLKPHPHLLTTALAALGVPAVASTFLGDAVTDIAAAHAAGTRSIGYANKPGKTARLITAGADTVIRTLTTTEHIV